MAIHSDHPKEQERMGDSVLCACGCGQTFQEYDSYGRASRYIKGHYMKMLARKYRDATAKGMEPFR